MRSNKALRGETGKAESNKALRGETGKAESNKALRGEPGKAESNKALRGKTSKAESNKALRGKPDKADKQKRTQRWLRKAKPVIFLGCLMLSILLVLGGTLAWFTSADTVRNIVKQEEMAKEFIVVEVDEFYPEPDEGGIYTKKVGAQNIGDIPAFVRLLVLPVFISADDNLLPAVLGMPGTPPAPADANVIVTDFNLWDETTLTGDDWAYGGDGYYYYLHRLDPNDNTEDLGKNLFEHLKLVEPMPAGYENAKLVIEVKCEALEVKRYREGWWGLSNTTAPAASPLKEIDSRLQGQIG